MYSKLNNNSLYKNQFKDSEDYVKFIFTII